MGGERRALDYSLQCLQHPELFPALQPSANILENSWGVEFPSNALLGKLFFSRSIHCISKMKFLKFQVLNS
jgi:hypothetical protein